LNLESTLDINLRRKTDSCNKWTSTELAGNPQMPKSTILHNYALRKNLGPTKRRQALHNWPTSIRVSISFIRTQNQISVEGINDAARTPLQTSNCSPHNSGIHRDSRRRNSSTPTQHALSGNTPEPSQRRSKRRQSQRARFLCTPAARYPSGQKLHPSG
jgi:hypothetical protein